jgi:hypothetical protein
LPQLFITASRCGPGGKMSATVFGSGAADAAGAPLLVAAGGLSVPGAPASVQALTEIPVSAATIQMLARGQQRPRPCLAEESVFIRGEASA